MVDTISNYNFFNLLLYCIIRNINYDKLYGFYSFIISMFYSDQKNNTNIRSEIVKTIKNNHNDKVHLIYIEMNIL